jgi:hypothetical protein
MSCRGCGRSLERPGDYCLTCDTANADAVVVAIDPDRAVLTILVGEEVLGRTQIPTTPEDGGELSVVQVRNYAGRIADQIRRKRPEAVYVTGERRVIQSLRAAIRYPVYRVPETDPVDAVLEGRGERELEVVERPAAEKIGGAHSTVIGGRTGQRALQTVAEHPNVKKVIPGPIDAGGSGSQTGLRAKVTRADENGNLRLLVRDGSSIQENRVVTTARDRDTGERVRTACNEALSEAGLREA